MRIEGIESFVVESPPEQRSPYRWLVIKVHTDKGIVGVGESGYHGLPDAALAAIEAQKRYLVGQDPFKIEHHFQYLYRFAHFRGAAITASLSAIDIALWDILGKALDMPVYQLLGGKCRDKVRLYIHIRGDTLDELAKDAQRAVKEGFTVLRFSPFSEKFYDLSYSGLIEDAVKHVAAVREAVGFGVDICIDAHRRLTPAEAVVLGGELERFRLMFYEDPIRPDSVQSMAEVARKVKVPIATGERLETMYDFRELLQAGACQYVRPDVCLCGGITQTKKIAAIAESFNAGVIPHNPLSPVSTAACVQIDACIPNFIVQEYTGENEPPKNVMVKKPLVLDNGYLVVPDAPGIGIELNDDFFKSHRTTPRPFTTPIRQDGSVADW